MSVCEEDEAEGRRRTLQQGPDDQESLAAVSVQVVSHTNNENYSHSVSETVHKIMYIVFFIIVYSSMLDIYRLIQPL